MGNSFWREFDRSVMHPNTYAVKIAGIIWTIDSWDNEMAIITIYDQNGVTLAT
jgi:hypothetical protein